jgi:hypothetical protein
MRKAMRRRIPTCAVTAESAALVAENQALLEQLLRQAERLRANLLEFRVQELRQQLAMGDLRRFACGAGKPAPAPASGDRATVVVLEPLNPETSPWPTKPTTVH